MCKGLVCSSTMPVRDACMVLNYYGILFLHGLGSCLLWVWVCVCVSFQHGVDMYVTGKCRAWDSVWPILIQK